MAWTLEEVGAALAGVDALPVLAALEGKVVEAKSGGSTLYFNEKTLELHALALEPDAGPFVMAHEFGHAYHCYYWPERSATFTTADPRAEAVALAAEIRLAAMGVEPGEWAQRRLTLEAYLHGHRAVLDILVQDVQNSGSFHETVRLLVQRDLPA